ncbi:MAG: hypothetical protein BM557_01400 [Flavobacterium sp. MedPE-SWcel]|uniref:hypothetical protein n=1 Tax=uncultured Flavobacterium sp. TaxID=165435 RepID=UPI00090F905C|nr:hypothetical protein [uncultured Flavobacterium sp.]OIQ22062.1 MAG: hypothetical protein BM557_01400 [Flavobacterium sp. MedPE-SWcel]
MSLLTLNPVQQNIQVFSTAFVQDWDFNPDEIIIDYYQGTPMPNPIVGTTKIKDILGTPAVNGMTDIRYRTYVQVSGFPECVVMSGDLYTGSTATNPITASGIQGTMTYTFQNLNLLPVSSGNGYVFNMKHVIYGTSESTGGTITLASKTFPIRINVYPDTAPIISPAAPHFVWQIGNQEAMTVPLTINAPHWDIRIPAILFPGGSGFDIATLPEGGNIVSGTGETTIDLLLFSTIETYDTSSNPFTIELIVNGGLMTIPVQIMILQNSGMFLEKTALYFEAYKGITTPETQHIQTYYPGQYNFIVPPWLTVVPAPASYSNNLGFSVLNADSMEPGIYEADVIVINSENSQELATIQVVYNVIGNIHLPYPKGGNAFTLDNNIVTFSSQQENTYYDVVLKARVFAFYTNEPKDYSFTFKVPLFNKKQEINIGKKVDRLMSTMPDFTTHDTTPYLPAQIGLDITEKSFSDPDYTQEYQIENINFIAGLSPELYNGSGFLEVNTLPSRQTPNSYAYLNVLVANYPYLKIFKNGELLTTIGLLQGIVSLKVNFETYQAKQGDIFEYQIETSQGNFSKQYKIFPPGYDSNTIVWENEYKLKSALEFTGKYTLKATLENRGQSLQKNLVAALVKLENNKTYKLTINTGYILKSDVPSIESLCRAKRAALVLPNQTINLVPIQKTITAIDSDAALIAYDIEFEINRTYDEEVYTF